MKMSMRMHRHNLSAQKQEKIVCASHLNCDAGRPVVQGLTNPSLSTRQANQADVSAGVRRSASREARQ